MSNRLNSALKARQRALEAAHRLGREDDVVIHRHVIRLLHARLGHASLPAAGQRHR